MTVSREEFDKLVNRVDRIERTLAATVEIVSAEVVGLRTYLDERFAAVDRRLDGIDTRLDRIDARFDGIDARFDGSDARFDASDARFDGIDARFDASDARFDASDARLDGYTAQVQQAIKLGSDAAARNARFARAIADHFGIELPDDPQ